jgi:hypothetical protein
MKSELKYLLNWDDSFHTIVYEDWNVLRFVDGEYFGEFRKSKNYQIWEILSLNGHPLQHIIKVFSFDKAKEYIENAAFNAGYKFLPEHLKILL